MKDSGSICDTKQIVEYLIDHPLRAGQPAVTDLVAAKGSAICGALHTFHSGKDVLLIPVGNDSVSYVLEGRAIVGRLERGLPFASLEHLHGGLELVSTGEPLLLPGGAAHILMGHPNSDCELLLLGIGDRPASQFLEGSEPFVQEVLAAAASINDYYCGYDDRYREVYRNEAELWETDQPNQSLTSILEQHSSLLTGKVVDLGCGEGRDTLYLASLGADVLGVDLSRAAIDKGRERAARAGLTNARFAEGDVIYLRNLENESFDFALNMGCLHMLTDPEHRTRHINRVFEILKPGGYFLVDHCQRNWGKGFFSIPDYDSIASDLVPGRHIPRRIRAKSEMKSIKLKVLPFSETLKEDLVGEVCRPGFKVVDSALTNTEAFGDSALVLFRKS